ncbi:MAG: hypothetical protein EAY75_11445 [Bacteroidetes bacterium]|nr:MAG: hypothetical protein EAY75_11445 [Bacteroidota bacterium]
MPTELLAVVLTADVVGSTGYSEAERYSILATLKQCNLGMQALMPDFAAEIFQGDSFQGSTSQHRHAALRAALYAVCSFKAQGTGLRLSLGIGNITFRSGTNLTSDGTAYQHSGRQLEWLKKNNQFLSVAFDNMTTNNEWKVHSATLNHLLKHLTKAQAKAISLACLGGTQASWAQQLGIKQPAIQKRLAAAGWSLFELIIERFAQVA